MSVPLLADPMLFLRQVREAPGVASREAIDAFRALFADRALDFEPVAFLSLDQYRRLTEQLEALPRADKAMLRRYLCRLTRWQDDPAAPVASVDGSPSYIDDAWRRGLREAIGNENLWRNPRVVCAASDRAGWPPGEELSVTWDEQTGMRVIAGLEASRQHSISSPIWIRGTGGTARETSTGQRAACRGRQCFAAFPGPS